MCLYPKLITNKKYTATKKNGGRIPTAADDRVLKVPVGCGRCMECMKQKTRQWKVRLYEEIKSDKTGKFVTLTFSNDSFAALAKKCKGEGYELDNEIATYATRKFLERWRKKHKKSVKHWLVTELGHNGTENIHLHGILWTEKTQDIKDTWKYGYVYIGEYVNDKTINYIGKYVTKVDIKHKEYKPKILTSAGIGKEYIGRKSKRNEWKEEGTIETYKTRQGNDVNLPIYYRNKIYSEEEREKLWLEKLDKQERWVCGEKVDVSTEKGWERYHKLVKQYRNKNKRLGYGNDEKNWERKKYEEEVRKLKHKERGIIKEKIEDKEKNNEWKWYEEGRKRMKMNYVAGLRPATRNTIHIIEFAKLQIK